MVKKGRLHSASFHMNQFASKPFVETKHPRTFPLVTPNINFSALSYSLPSRIFVKVSARSEM
jgi:hypothetical protein